MSSRILKPLLAASLALNLGFAAAVAYRHLGTAAPAHDAVLADRLGLSPVQREAWDALEQPFLRDLAQNWADIHAQRDALLDAIFADAPDRGRVAALRERIAGLQDEQQQRVVAQLLAEQALLDAGQRAALKSLLVREYGDPAAEIRRLHGAGR